MAAVLSMMGIVVGSLLFALAVWQGLHWLTGVGILLLAIAMIVGLQGPKPIATASSATDPSQAEVDSESSQQPGQNAGGSADSAAQ